MEIELPRLAHVVSPEMQETRATFLSHAVSFLADPDSGESRGWYNQTISMLGREDLMGLIPHDPKWFSKFDCTGGPANALDEIVARAAGHTVVIINEDHSKPHHRLFIADVIRQLEVDGFTHYAAETLTPDAPGRSGAATLGADGWYTRDPVYARVLEQVRASGMTLVAYEQRMDQRLAEDASMEDSIAAREEAQATNLVDAVFAAAPDTRIIIHVGHAHVEEVAYEGGHTWMAARLKEKTGIDPLTVELTHCAPGGTHPVTAPAMSRAGEPYTLRTDLVVRFPELTFTDNRPDYRRTPGMQDISVPSSLLPEDGSVIIEARRIGDDDDVIPIDRLFVRPGEKVPLILPPGEYSVAAFDMKGLAAGPIRLSVTP